MILIEYEKFVNYSLGLHTNGKRRLKGKFKELKGRGKIFTEELDCLNHKDDAKKSYQAVLDYFNYTRSENEPFRYFVSAKWLSKRIE